MEVILRDGESQEGLLTRFKKGVERSGLMREMKSKRYFVSRSERERIATRNAIRREAKNRRRAESRG
ncbi:MAG: 30S ribosomal protein S21 [Dehalococcoidia bacterium]|nr:30S ribosomal protein S21 [Dehalococcoidia bacterium]